MLTELKIIRNILIRLVLGFFFFTFIFLFLPVEWLGGSFSNWVIGQIRVQFIPEGAVLAVLGPLDAFFSQATVAAFLACLLLVPMAFVELWRFAAPALDPREAAIFAAGLVGALFLSAFGAYFSYILLVPLMFTELFMFVPNGVEAIFNLQKVVSLIAGFVLGCALIFLLPLVMIILSYIGLIPARLWAAYARPAVLLVLVASAIITPDGSGVGMVLLSVPVCALYAVGYSGAVLATKE